MYSVCTVHFMFFVASYQCRGTKGMALSSVSPSLLLTWVRLEVLRRHAGAARFSWPFQGRLFPSWPGGLVSHSQTISFTILRVQRRSKDAFRTVLNGSVAGWKEEGRQGCVEREGAQGVFGHLGERPIHSAASRRHSQAAEPP